MCRGREAYTSYEDGSPGRILRGEVRVHTTIYHPLEVVDLHCCCAISNCEFFELLYPLSYMDFGMKNKLQLTPKATHILRKNPELEFDLDWDFVDSCTVECERPSFQVGG